MQVKFFTISIIGGEAQEAELNRFLRSRKILETERHLVQHAQGAHWCFCITYLEGNAGLESRGSQKEKPDYKKLLDAATFERFNRLRQIRKELADREAIPAYAVFTNAELAEIAKLGDQPALSNAEKFRKNVFL